MRWTDGNTIIGHIAITVLGVACFPANPLVFAEVVKTDFNLPLFAAGWLVWSTGMVLVMTPIVMFPRHGGVPKGKSFVYTTKLVETGVYGVVRHPQYLGGILSIFLTTLIWYPHWLFAILGTIGALVLYWSAWAEDRRLVEQYGTDYVDYMRRVPRMNIILGIVRLRRSRKQNQIEAKQSSENG